MSKTLLKTLSFSLFLVLNVVLLKGQGTTTSGMNGTVTDENGEPIPGATVIAVHQPTNAQFGNVTDVTGNYRLSNMNVGGPYTVSISFVGFETFTQPNVYLDLGQTYKLDAKLGDEVTTLEAVEVIATTGDVFDGNRSAPETVVNDYTIHQLPTVSRDLNDFTRLTPLANTSVGIDGAISFGGLNNRYNSVFIDGAATNDYFGLANNGTNGGQTGISPISVDGIEQFQVVLAPYDVTQGGLAGAGISAVTRTGSNEFEGSAWYLVSNEGLTGKTPTDDPNVERTKLADFSNKTYGVRIGGPLIKDKLFFFALAEMQRDETPQPFALNEYLGDADETTLDQIGDWVRTPNQILGNTEGYEPGEWRQTTNKLDGEKFMLNLDWNINQQHKLAVRYRYTKAEQAGPERSSNTLINFSNSGQTFPSITNNGSIELKSNFTNSSNSLLLGLTTVRDDREVTGQPFPSLAIEDGGSGSLIILGGEPFSHSNVVNQDVITLTNNFNLYRGRHTLTFGTHNEYFNILNIFLPFHPPQYTFSSTDKFLQTIPEAYLFLYGHEQFDEHQGDEAVSVAADFSTLQLGFYVQDEFQVNDNLKLTGGLRVDIPIFLTDGVVNDDFNNSTVPILEGEGYDLQGATAGQVPGTQLHWSPRFGFNWDVNGNKQTQVRGGLGIFTSRIPYVWPGGIYLRNGLTSGFTVGFNGDGFAPPSGDGSLGIPLETDLTMQPSNKVSPQGTVDLFADDFKFPQIFKMSLGVDHKLPWWGLIGTLDAQYTSKVNDINYTMVNKPIDPVGNLTGTPDNRPIFDPTFLDPTYTYITLADNTSKGNTFSFTAQVQKPLQNGFTGSLAYSYTHAESLFDGTIFINENQWNEYHSVNGRNNPSGLQRSQYATGSRIVGFISKRWEYAEHFATSVSLFYNGQSGLPYSYVYNDNDGMLNNDDPNLDEPRNLIYVPASQSEIIFGELVDDGMGGQMVAEVPEEEAGDQWNALEAFINRDDYLSENRGRYMERNGARMPSEHILDFRAAQEFFINTNAGRRHTLEVSIDIFNFTNLLNKDWGRRYLISDSQNFQLIDFVGFLPGTSTPTFSFSDPGDPWSVIQSGVNSARWSARLGLRYSF